jgi:hypothetical protein
MLGIHLRVAISLNYLVCASGRILGPLGKSIKSHALDLSYSFPMSGVAVDWTQIRQSVQQLPD